MYSKYILNVTAQKKARIHEEKQHMLSNPILSDQIHVQ